MQSHSSFVRAVLDTPDAVINIAMVSLDLSVLNANFPNTFAQCLINLQLCLDQILSILPFQSQEE